MNFWKNLHPLLQRNKSNYGSTNYAVLSSLQTILGDAEEDTINKRVQLLLMNAVGDYLDVWGSWFNVFRQDGENDENYRDRILKYILIARSTIPAIIDGIGFTLTKQSANIAVYEPWRNIFTLNKSKLNGYDHLEGFYYRYAVIDVNMDIPVTQAIKDAIMAFKPAGVTMHTTYPISDIAKLNIATLISSDAPQKDSGVAETNATITVGLEVDSGTTTTTTAQPITTTTTTTQYQSLGIRFLSPYAPASKQVTMHVGDIDLLKVANVDGSSHEIKLMTLKDLSADVIAFFVYRMSLKGLTYNPNALSINGDRLSAISTGTTYLFAISSGALAGFNAMSSDQLHDEGIPDGVSFLEITVTDKEVPTTTTTTTTLSSSN